MSDSKLAASDAVMRDWSPKFTPDQIRAVVADYQSGRYTGVEIQKKYGLGHNTLYRWVRKFKAMPDPHASPVYLRSEIARLRALVVELAMENKRLSDAQKL